MILDLEPITISSSKSFIIYFRFLFSNSFHVTKQYIKFNKSQRWVKLQSLLKIAYGCNRLSKSLQVPGSRFKVSSCLKGNRFVSRMSILSIISIGMASISSEIATEVAVSHVSSGEQGAGESPKRHLAIQAARGNGGK
ncbi:unnamed protein product [Vicia faba]|uniref:Uncharacterized protein n=1 Tax=Vicia faba TaxID=3906 RepID=A0AAV0YWL9_VICFA|nr:unnamed protein product [Vicia faba]